MTDRYWYPIYEKLVELDVPAMIHVSASCNPSFHTTGAHYIAADTAVFMQLLTADLFADFPTLRLIIPHGGGAVPYHWGRYRGIAQDLGKPPIEESLMRNVSFDTCVYHRPGIELLTQVVPIGSILFASEMIGAVRGTDPRTGHHYDDTKLYLDAVPALSPEHREAIFHANAERIYPRLKVLPSAERSSRARRPRPDTSLTYVTIVPSVDRDRLGPRRCAGDSHGIPVAGER
jgi:4-oxalmesaconate hydratase